MKKVNFFVVLLIVATAIAIVVAWWGASTVPFAIEHAVQAQYQSMPDRDNELEQWIREQPGVGKARVVHSSRGVHVHFVMTQNLLRTDPPTPDLRAALDEFGYRGELRF